MSSEQIKFLRNKHCRYCVLGIVEGYGAYSGDVRVIAAFFIIDDATKFLNSLYGRELEYGVSHFGFADVFSDLP